jgi:hypothetical protein
LKEKFAINPIHPPPFSRVDYLGNTTVRISVLLAAISPPATYQFCY